MQRILKILSNFISLFGRQSVVVADAVESMLNVKDVVAAKSAAALAAKGKSQTPDVGASSSVNAPANCPKRISKALKTHIASFRNSQQPPPCRSYRNLVTLIEFQEFFKKKLVRFVDSNFCPEIDSK